MADVVIEPMMLYPAHPAIKVTIDGAPLPSQEVLLLRELRDILRELLDVIKSPLLVYDEDIDTHAQARLDASYQE